MSLPDLFTDCRPGIPFSMAILKSYTCNQILKRIMEIFYWNNMKPSFNCSKFNLRVEIQTDFQRHFLRDA